MEQRNQIGVFVFEVKQNQTEIMLMLMIIIVVCFFLITPPVNLIQSDIGYIAIHRWN